jgi:hypothetical protein
MLTNIFKLSSYIQKITQNLINAFKKTNYNTKHTKNTNIYFPKSNIFEQITKHNFRDIQKKHHNSILLYIYIYSIIRILYILYILYVLYIYLSIDVRGPFRTPNPNKSQTKWSVRRLFTLLGHFLKMFEKMFKHTFNLCSHIELNTQNPNTIFKITIYYSK